MKRVGVLLVASIVLAVGVGTASPPRARNARVTWATDDGIYVANVDGTQRRKLVPDWGDCVLKSPSWTRDGRALAYVVCFSDAHRIEILWRGTYRNNHVADVDLASAGQLSNEPAWSPDGKRIAVTEVWGIFGPDGWGATIEIVTVAKNRWSSVTARKRHRIDSEPAWSPDGRTIAFTRQQRGGTFVYFVRPDGSGLRRFAKGHSSSWSPDGKRLAFVLAGSVYEIGADGRGRRRILGGLRDALVRWSPDGRKLLYTSSTSSRDLAGNPTDDVWTADVDGSHRRRILHRVDLYGIAWRPRP